MKYMSFLLALICLFALCSSSPVDSLKSTIKISDMDRIFPSTRAQSKGSVSSTLEESAISSSLLQDESTKPFVYYEGEEGKEQVCTGKWCSARYTAYKKKCKGLKCSWKKDSRHWCINIWGSKPLKKYRKHKRKFRRDSGTLVYGRKCSQLGCSNSSPYIGFPRPVRC